MADDYKPSDELEQAYRQGYTTGRCTADGRLETIALHYGYERQREQFVEELAEAVLAVQKCKRHGSKENFDALAAEVADVLIMAQQMRLLMSTRQIDRIIDEKLERQLERIRKEDEKCISMEDGFQNQKLKLM